MIEVATHTPSLISWNLTKMCNLRCPHCYMEAGKKAERELSTDECLRVLDELGDLGTEMLILTGGEPLLRRDIFEIATAASAKGMWVVMGTNGVLVTDAVAARMVDCGVKGVAISIDSVDPAKHNAFRGGPDAWEHSVRAMDVCRAKGLEVLMQTTIMDMNYDELPELVDFARRRGAWSFNLYFLVQTGRGHQMNDLSPQRTHAALAQMVDLQEDFKPMLVRSKCAPQYKQIAYAAGRGGLESGGCMAGVDYARITPNGDVTPCPYMEVVAGNVLDSSFADIWSTSPVLSDLRDTARLKGRCGSCEFNELCGGCRCRAYSAFGDYLQEDPACTYQPTGERLMFAEATWSESAENRVNRIPISFIREKVRLGVQAYARRFAIQHITDEVMDAALPGNGRPAAFGGLPAFGRRPDRSVDA
jgi:radical SAM protein with 4Fe4S-binding SPASM domain